METILKVSNLNIVLPNGTNIVKDVSFEIKSGEVVASVVRKDVKKGSRVLILAGKGNNGGDGYAAAVKLMDDYDVKVCDIFSAGQRTNGGKYFLAEYLSRGGEVFNYEPTNEMRNEIRNASCIIDAIFGTGFHGEMPEKIRPLAIMIREMVGAYKLAIDVPLGINADDGSVSEFAISVDTTVELSYIKPGIISYPARSYVGKIVYDDLGLPRTEIAKEFHLKYNLIDKKFVSLSMPRREENSNKGTFGKLLMITGSSKFRGAARLGLEAALRGGVGLVTFVGSEALCADLSVSYPEAIYKPCSEIENISDEEIESIVKLSEGFNAIVVGSGSGSTDGLSRLVFKLLQSEGSSIILDADAINVLAFAGKNGVEMIKNAKRTVILTPHPLEYARLIDKAVADVQLHRLEVSENFAEENSCIVVLKGSGTIVTNGKDVYINGRGSSALAKAGSGDVLAGLIGALVAQRKISDTIACALAVYFHSIAGDKLAEEYSSYGVTPSDLPKEIARQISNIIENNNFLSNVKL